MAHPAPAGAPRSLAAAGDHPHSPLNTVAGFTDPLLAEAAPQLDETSRGFLDRIRHSTQKMIILVAARRAPQIGIGPSGAGSRTVTCVPAPSVDCT